MQVLCGLQVVFFLFNCQTPVLRRFFFGDGKAIEGAELRVDIWGLATGAPSRYNLVFDTF